MEKGWQKTYLFNPEKRRLQNQLALNTEKLVTKWRRRKKKKISVAHKTEDLIWKWGKSFQFLRQQSITACYVGR